MRPDSEAIDRHAAECEECAQYLLEDRAFEARLRALPALPVSEGFSSQVMARVRTSASERQLSAQEAGSSAFPILAWGTAIFGVLLVITGYSWGLVEEGMRTALDLRLASRFSLQVSSALKGLLEPSLPTALQVSGLALLLAVYLHASRVKTGSEPGLSRIHS
jgi:anti-sigma factor RsiW